MVRRTMWLGLVHIASVRASATVRPMFERFSMVTGTTRALTHGEARFTLWCDAVPAGLVGTHFGVVHAGPVVLAVSTGTFPLQPGMVFCTAGDLSVRGEGQVLGVTHHDGGRGFFQLAGPAEERGRLRYIDGCTDSLLIAPQVRGEPCLNHLHFPPGVEQTFHTHPSFRAGLVLRGHGHCDGDGRVPLLAGDAFLIPADARHRFVTTDSSMDVIAFHPDSDFGPTHDDHPMVNRTMVDGVSARHLASIRT